jgi:hypothetical protein
MGGWVDAFEEAGTLWRFTGILDNINSTLLIAEKYRDLPPALLRTFVYNSINRLDDFAKEYRGCIGKVMTTSTRSYGAS